MWKDGARALQAILTRVLTTVAVLTMAGASTVQAGDQGPSRHVQLRYLP